MGCLAFRANRAPRTGAMSQIHGERYPECVALVQVSLYRIERYSIARKLRKFNNVLVISVTLNGTPENFK